MFRYVAFLSVVLLFLLPSTLFGEEAGLTLARAIEIAIQHNPQIEIARQQCMQSQGRLTQARAGYLPQVAVDGSFSKMHIDNLAPVDEDNLTSGGVSVSQLIYDFGTTGGGIEAGRYGVEAAGENFRRLLQNVVFEVKSKYYLVLEKDWQVDVADLAVRNFEQHTERAQEHFNVGLKTKIDVTNAKVSLSNAKLDLLSAKADLQTSQVGLIKSLGRTPKEGGYTLAIAKGSPEQFAADKPPLDLSLETTLERAKENNPSLHLMEAHVKSAKSSLQQARGGYYPSLNLFAGYDTFETDIATLTDQWQAGVGLRWDIFSGFATRGKVAEATGHHRELQAGMRDLQLGVAEEATKSYLRAREYSQQVDIAAETLALASENLEVAKGRYENGLSEVIEFNDAQYNFTQSQSNLLSAYYSYLISLARIELATGVVPEIEVLPENTMSTCFPGSDA